MKRTATGIALLASTLCAALAMHAQTTPAKDPWWKHAAIYEIYPRSFGDTNGDGLGDLNGITAHMGYLNQLGVDTIWIAPMYPSPQVDFGYDISDYVAVAPEYGTMADFDEMMASARQHHIRVVLDFVLNHTSDKHKWFLESASSRTNPKADWYVWNDGVPADGPNVGAYQKRWVQQSNHGPVVPPNNWKSGFGGSAWEWVPARQQFYYHKFYKQQPDLNWRNPAVEKAMYDVIRFWLDRGVAGFRLDAVPTLFEDTQLRNEPERGGINAQGDPNLRDIYTNNLPEVHDVMRKMRAIVDSYPGDRVLIGETYLPNAQAMLAWYGGDKLNELQLPMDMRLGFNSKNANHLDATHFRTVLTEEQTVLRNAQSLLVFDNHDNPRSWNRFGDGKHDPQIARILSTVLYTTPATAMTYYGAELGMTTQTPTRKGDVRDPIGITGWPKEKGRDGERTPMQWTPGPQAGFSTNPNTWLPVEPTYKSINVQSELADPHSLLTWNRTLLKLRSSDPVMRHGSMLLLDVTNESVLSYMRVLGKRAIVVSLNMSAVPQTVHLDLSAARIMPRKATPLLVEGSSLGAKQDATEITLQPFGTMVAEIP
ncbi:alpha-glucosidase [Granulicella cerasi]|uniref:Alpha-glucosidase n=1 Tax=Granulicella cerasi TaxID=741063 RepID=A0ABW1ZAM3_9BACT|nr:alpha-glucosidase [Granulicella cerasi]